MSESLSSPKLLPFRSSICSLLFSGAAKCNAILEIELTEPGEARPGKPCGNVLLPLYASQLVGSSSPLRPRWWCHGGLVVVRVWLSLVWHDGIHSIHPSMDRSALQSAADCHQTRSQSCPLPSDKYVDGPAGPGAHRFQPGHCWRSLSGDDEVHGRFLQLFRIKTNPDESSVAAP